MGTGKTFIGAAAVHMAGLRRILVICPSHLVPKWKREVEQTALGARAAVVESITDLERRRLSLGSGPLFAVLSREKAKLSYRWKVAVIRRRAADVQEPEPPQARLRRLRLPLWQARQVRPKRYPLSDYVKHHMKGFFDLLIGDECHEFKGRGSAQGIAAGVLAEACGKSLSLTGTLLGGYASTIFHLLYRCAQRSA